jgi:hypothetical protein
MVGLVLDWGLELAGIAGLLCSSDSSEVKPAAGGDGAFDERGIDEDEQRTAGRGVEVSE